MDPALTRTEVAQLKSLPLFESLSGEFVTIAIGDAFVLGGALSGVGMPEAAATAATTAAATAAGSPGAAAMGSSHSAAPALVVPEGPLASAAAAALGQDPLDGAPADSRGASAVSPVGNFSVIAAAITTAGFGLGSALPFGAGAGAATAAASAAPATAAGTAHTARRVSLSAPASISDSFLKARVPFKALYEELGVRVLGEAELLHRYLLPKFSLMSPQQKYTLMVSVRVRAGRSRELAGAWGAHTFASTGRPRYRCIHCYSACPKHFDGGDHEVRGVACGLLHVLPLRAVCALLPTAPLCSVCACVCVCARVRVRVCVRTAGCNCGRTRSWWWRCAHWNGAHAAAPGSTPGWRRRCSRHCGCLLMPPLQKLRGWLASRPPPRRGPSGPRLAT